jgi:hypothetical protein
MEKAPGEGLAVAGNVAICPEMLPEMGPGRRGRGRAQREQSIPSVIEARRRRRRGRARASGDAVVDVDTGLHQAHPRDRQVLRRELGGSAGPATRRRSGKRGCSRRRERVRGSAETPSMLKGGKARAGGSRKGWVRRRKVSCGSHPQGRRRSPRRGEGGMLGVSNKAQQLEAERGGLDDESGEGGVEVQAPDGGVQGNLRPATPQVRLSRRGGLGIRGVLLG